MALLHVLALLAELAFLAVLFILAEWASLPAFAQLGDLALLEWYSSITTGVQNVHKTTCQKI